MSDFGSKLCTASDIITTLCHFFCKLEPSQVLLTINLFASLLHQLTSNKDWNRFPFDFLLVLRLSFVLQSVLNDHPQSVASVPSKMVLWFPTNFPLFDHYWILLQFMNTVYEFALLSISSIHILCTIPILHRVSQFYINCKLSFDLKTLRHCICQQTVIIVYFYSACFCLFMI